MDSEMTFDNLPNELKDAIFKHLPVKTKKSARLVSRNWRQLIDRSLTFKLKLDDSSYRHVMNFSGIIRKLRVSNLNRTSSIPVSSRRNIFSQVDCLYLHEGISPDNFSKILNYSQKSVKNLSLNESAVQLLKEPTIQFIHNMENLVWLEIQSKSFHLKQSDILRNLLRFSYFPRLRKAVFDMECDYGVYYQLDHFLKDYISIWFFVVKHRRVLKDLSYRAPNEFDDVSTIATSTANEEAETIQMLMKNMDELDLNSLDVTVTDIEGKGSCNFILKMMETQRHLKRFLIHHRIHPKVEQTIKNNASTLTEFLFSNDSAEPNFDCNWLKGLNLYRVGLCSYGRQRVLNFPDCPASNIEYMCLSMVFNPSDIELISSKYQKLRELWLIDPSVDVPLQTRLTYEGFLKLIKLTKLSFIICVCRIQYDKILKFCTSFPGLRIVKKGDSPYFDPPTPKYEIYINRKVFSVDACIATLENALLAF